MRKIYIIVIALVFAQSMLAQDPAIKSDLPTVIPPSPTVAALMKFEEVPVSNYTGVPDISIPLISTATLSKDLNLDISLKYHPSSASASEVASDVGLGWSLFAGGTISRTVRGLPDEYYRTFSSNDETGKFGIYRNTGTIPYVNPYYKFADDTAAAEQDPDSYKEFLWETNEKGKYDTEHDLWQYNFMGHSGQFIIKKNSAGILEVANQKLDDNLKIINRYYNGTNIYDLYSPTSFEVYDDKGYKFVFDIVEETQSNSSSQITYFGVLGYPNDYRITASLPIVYKSAFQLSKIYDNNNNPIIEFKYNDENEIMNERTVDKTYTINQMVYTNPRDFLQVLIDAAGPEMQSQNQKLEPKEIISFNTRTVSTKKIKEIQSVGISKIFFTYEDGREDTDYNASSYRLQSITQKTWAGSFIKNIELFHSYSEILKKRMVLDSVTLSNIYNNKFDTFKLEYETNPTGSQFVGKDYWGNFNLRPFNDNGGTFRETTPSFCTSDLLQKMTLPTGGCIIYDFEPNQYSYVGAELLPNFDENPDNWSPQSDYVTFHTTVSNKTNFFTINDMQTVAFEAVTNTGSYDWRFRLYKVINSTTDVELTNFPQLNCENGNCVFYYSNLEPGQYKVDFSTVDLNFPEIFTATITARYKTRSNANKQFLYGGGNRIRRIGFFEESNVDRTFYREASSSFTPKKEKNYEYTFFDNSLKSSGSLVFAKPKFDFMYNKTHHFVVRCAAPTGQDEGICFQFIRTFTYQSFTDVTNLQILRTQGADVGYKNVTVFEKDNGKTEFVYSSPIDVPESDEAYDLTPPFFPAHNYDYKRGLIQNEKIVAADSKPLKETIFNYSYQEVPLENTLFGIRTTELGGNCPYSYLYKRYSFGVAGDTYKGCLDFCSSHSGPLPPDHPFYGKCGKDCGDVLDFIGNQQLFEANGWAKLISKTTKNYFYPNGSSTPNIVQTNETYDYNLINKRISESTVTNSKGEVLKTDYFYHTGNSPTSQNRISEIERIESYNGSELVSTSKIVYSDTFAGNSSYLPQTIQTAKGAQGLEDRVRYNAYDAYGHPLEVQKENGMVISYIWGYNKSQPIAKIENASSAQIESALGMTMDAINESNLPSDIRTTLPDAMITTYTYKPLVGVETITDPKGDVTTYVYDSFGRLSAVKDALGFILSENEYNYRTQN